ncbi:uncharacterized protein [Littorina saxatilis]|uniref:Alpha-type protein kinase domain-containing protein n=1 Tax=Littorina saxatilis TaxID=31220 RepID=A0AAN9GNQ6_9CAEN
MPSLCNTTLSSSADRDDFQYWSSFCEKPFSCGDRLQVYKGKLNGKGPRGGDFSVVKVFSNQPGTQSRCHVELAKSQACSDWLRRFLALGRYRQRRLQVAQLQMAPMDQVSLLNKVFAHNKRRPHAGEWILLEEMIQERGQLVSFVDKHGRMFRERAMSAGSGPSFVPPSSSRCAAGSDCGSTACRTSSSKAPECSVDDRELVEALVHYSHQASGGQLVLCGLEGVKDDHGHVMLKNPVIHSRQKRYGETDLGAEGVDTVIRNHVCNRHCRRVFRLHHSSSTSSTSSTSSSDSSSLPPSPPSYPRQHRSPSAPFEPDVIMGHDVMEDRSSPLPSAPPYDEIDVFNMNVSQLPLDVFAALPPQQIQAFLFSLSLEKYPDEPPPPYTEYSS